VSPVKTGSVMREEGVTLTEQAAGTRVWWKRINPNQRSGWQTLILLRELVFFLCRLEHWRALCKERAISILLVIRSLHNICRQRETSKNIYGGICLLICFSQWGYSFRCYVLHLGFMIYGSCSASLQQSFIQISDDTLT